MTNRMTEEKAREIVANFKNQPTDIGGIADYEYAKGYLNALEDECKRAEGLVMAAKMVVSHFSVETEKDPKIRFAIGAYSAPHLIQRLKESLSRYIGKEKK